MGSAIARGLDSDPVEDDGDRPVRIVLKPGQPADEFLSGCRSVSSVHCGEVIPVEDHAMSIDEQDFLFHFLRNHFASGSTLALMRSMPSRANVLAGYFFRACKYQASEGPG